VDEGAFFHGIRVLFTVVGVQPRQSSIYQSHFVKFYGGLNQGIRELSMITGAQKCPVKCDLDVVEVQLYIRKLFDFFNSNPKKFTAQ
jgi:hypothetical protein